MAQKCFCLLDNVFNLMLEKKLRKNIDDTLFEKLLSLIKKCELQKCGANDCLIVTHENPGNMHFDFIEELVKRTSLVCLIEKVICSVSERNENHSVAIKSFALRLLGLIFECPKEFFPLENLIKASLFKDKNSKIINHIPSIQDALLACLSCITKQFRGALWFINNNLEEFVFSSFNSSSYYVRKSAANFFVNFITTWASVNVPSLEGRKTEEMNLEFLRNIVSYIIQHIHLYKNSKEMVFAECCIYITKELFEFENFERIMGDYLNLAKDISQCFIELSEDKDFNNKLIDLFLAIHFKSKLADEVIIDVIKCLILKEDIELSMNLASSFAKILWPKCYESREITFFLLPIYVLTNTPLNGSNGLFQVDSDLIYNVLLKKMENKPQCRLLFSSSLCALQKLIPLLHEQHQRDLAVKIYEVVRSVDFPQHKWLCSLLEDRTIHHSFLELFSSFLSDDVYPSLIFEGSDLLFQIIMELLKKPTSDSNFLSELLLLMKKLLILHESLKFELRDADKDSLIEALCRMLLDKRESVIDSAIYLSGHILCLKTFSSWQEKVSKQNIHSLIWDIAIHGSHNGSIRSTALKVIIEGCLQVWCLNEMKSLKEVTETDIVKILFDLTFDPDFFLQREALSCLFHWMESKWDHLPSSSREYLFSALVLAIKSLDLELKLTSLDVWLWLIEHKFKYSGMPSEIKQYIKYLTDNGFGLSLLLAFEDYDEAVKFKAADILLKLKTKLISNSISVDCLKMDSPAEAAKKCHISTHMQPFTVEERDEGINNVMEISTAEQITNISRPFSLSDLYNFKQEYFSVDSEDRKCSLSVFWTHLWSENFVSIVHPTKAPSDINSDIESLLNDIIAAKVSELESIEDTLDCY